MRVVIVAKTRRGSAACVGALSWSGQSLRLIHQAEPPFYRPCMEYQTGEVWEVEGIPAPHVEPPHTENFLVSSSRRLGLMPNLAAFIQEQMPPVSGSPQALFHGLLQMAPSGGLHISQAGGVPSHSTTFWLPDQPLLIARDAKRIHYRYGQTEALMPFVGFQDPPDQIPPATLVRVSLAHWWRPKDRPEEELRCYAQLSGWIEPGNPKPAARESAGTLSPAENSNGQRAQPSPTLSCAPPPAPSVSEPALVAQAKSCLKEVFGFDNFYPLQEKAVLNLITQHSSLVIMPTGGGKSLCYQLPALLFPGLTVVVSPLIALMQDQVAHLHAAGVAAACLNSMLSHQDYAAVTRQVRSGQLRILYVAPETLLRPETLLLLADADLSCLAIDEAHCISEWGHDFRPEYRQLSEVRQRFAHAPCIALTATATTRVRTDIRNLLNIAPDSVFVSSFDRPNLFLSTERRTDGLRQTLAFLDAHAGQSGIVYCSTRKQVDELAAELAGRGWPAVPYHAGLDDSVRQKNQDRFRHEERMIVVATIAFGMGINKSNVRFILHFNLPKDLESYYQEVGRAGRDGLPADCLLLHSRSDAMTIQHFINQGAESERPGRQARLHAMLAYAEATTCRRLPLLRYFGEAAPAQCEACDNCCRQHSTAPAVEVTERAHLLFDCIRETNEIFGIAHIIGVLRGSRAGRLLRYRHDALQSYGRGSSHSTEAWRDLIHQLIADGYLKLGTEFSSLILTPKARQSLSQRQPVLARSTQSQPSPVRMSASPENDQLFQTLRSLRRELAARAGVPPYIIFSDRTLRELALHQPTNAQALLRIQGIGQGKSTSYGPAFLEAIRTFRQSSAQPAEPNPASSEQEVKWLTKRTRSTEIGERFQQGESIDQLALALNVQQITVIQHLDKFRAGGGQLPPQRILQHSGLSSANQQKVLATFEQLGLDRLAPVHLALNQTVSYEELHLLRLYARCLPGPESSPTTSTSTSIATTQDPP